MSGLHDDSWEPRHHAGAPPLPHEVGGPAAWACPVGAEWLWLDDLVPGEAHVEHRAPVSLALVKARDGSLVLVDTGLSPVAFAEPERLRGLYLRPCEGAAGAAVRALSALGVVPGDLALVILTHLHLDHTGGLASVPDVPVVVQAAELEWGRRAGPADAVLPEDLAAADGRWRVLEGPQEVVPGVEVVPTPGHTPGHQSVRVRLPTRDLLLVGDALERVADVSRDLPISPGDYPGAESDVRRSAARLRELGASCELVPCHDGALWSPPRWLHRS